jgi:hypothetical protein
LDQRYVSISQHFFSKNFQNGGYNFVSESRACQDFDAKGFIAIVEKFVIYVANFFDTLSDYERLIEFFLGYSRFRLRFYEKSSLSFSQIFSFEKLKPDNYKPYGQEKLSKEAEAGSPL